MVITFGRRGDDCHGDGYWDSTCSCLSRGFSVIRGEPGGGECDFTVFMLFYNRQTTIKSSSGFNDRSSHYSDYTGLKW